MNINAVFELLVDEMGLEKVTGPVMKAEDVKEFMGDDQDWLVMVGMPNGKTLQGKLIGFKEVTENYASIIVEQSGKMGYLRPQRTYMLAPIANMVIYKTHDHAEIYNKEEDK